MVSLPGKSNAVNNFPCRLLRLSAWRYAFQHPWQTWLNFVGIMLGVMMVVAIDLANNSASQAFTLSVATINGTITHQIVGGSDGVPDEIFTNLRTQLGIRRSAPGLSGQVNISDQNFTLLGLDVFSEASLERQRQGLSEQSEIFGSGLFTSFSGRAAVVMAQASAETLGLREGDNFTIRVSGIGGNNIYDTQVVLAAVLTTNNSIAESVVFADIALVQQILQTEGNINSIDLILEAEQVAQITQWLPSGLTLINAQTRNDSLQQMTSAFHINLLAMSLLSLLVAGLLIYNTVTLSVLQKEKTLGVFRSLGVSRQQIFYLILGESALLGFVASVVGLILGYNLGSMLVTLVSRAIPDSNFRINVTSFIIDPWSLVKGLMLGIIITLLSAALPAFHATHSQPVTLQHRALKDKNWQRSMPGLAIVGVLMMLAGFSLLQSEVGALVGGFVALTFIVFGYCFLVPGIMNTVLNLILGTWGSRLKLATRMALRNIQTGISRTGLAVAALTVAISVTVGVGVMVGSFRGTVVLWLEQSFSGDIQVAGSELTPQLRLDLSQLAGVGSVNGTISKEIESEFGLVRLTVSDLPAQQSYYLKVGNTEQLQAFNNGLGVMVSEPLAYLQELEVADSVTLVTDLGSVSLPVLGIFYDYTPGRGSIAMHASLYQQWWQTQSLSRLTIFNEEGLGADLLPGVKEVLDRHEGNQNALSNRDIRELTLTIFDRTFAITDVLRWLALLVAFVGVLSALMALLLERLREFAILRASGMTPRQVTLMVLSQTVLLGLFAGILALPLGLIMSDVLIDVINKRSFGWSMQHLLPVAVFIQAILLAIFAALVAGIYPAIKAARISPAAALREE